MSQLKAFITAASTLPNGRVQLRIRREREGREETFNTADNATGIPDPVRRLCTSVETDGKRHTLTLDASGNVTAITSEYWGSRPRCVRLSTPSPLSAA